MNAGWVIDNYVFPLLSRSIVGDSAHASWELSVEMPESGEIRWSNLPPGHRCSLNYDGQIVDMSEKESMYLPEGKHTIGLFLVDLPSRTRLLANYPNPCNPETWIPYQLKDDTNVTIRIYTLTGQLVRTLNMGHRQAGLHTDKAEAAYWDGRNEAGEHIASGVYFYTIQAGDYTATRKMVVAK